MNSEPIFSYLDEEKSHTLDESFDNKILDYNRSQIRRRPLFLRQIVRWAAAILIVAGMGFALSRILETEPPVDQGIVEFADTFEDPELAYQEVKKALMMLSSNMNTGIKQTTFIGEFHKAKEKLSHGHTVE